MVKPKVGRRIVLEAKPKVGRQMNSYWRDGHDGKVNRRYVRWFIYVLANEGSWTLEPVETEWAVYLTVAVNSKHGVDFVWGTSHSGNWVNSSISQKMVVKSSAGGRVKSFVVKSRLAEYVRLVDLPITDWVGVLQMLFSCISWVGVSVELYQLSGSVGICTWYNSI